MTDVFFTRPADDSSAAQTATWGQALIQRIGTRSYADLAGSAATRANVESELEAGAANLFHFGHGTVDSLLGHGGALVDDANVSSIPNLIVAMACESAILLGPEAVSTYGVGAYLGFDDEIGFPDSAPLPMGFAVIGGLDCLLTHGHSVECATTQLRQGLGTALRAYKFNGGSYGLSASEAKTAWLFMKSNLHSVCLSGDPTTSI